MDLTKGNEGRVIFTFAIPMLIGNVIQQSYNIFDAIIVGNYLGKIALAAVGASFPIIFLLISLIIGIASGSTIIIAQYYGARDMKNVKKTIDTMMVFLFFTSLFVSVIGVVFSGKVFQWLNLPDEIMPQAKLFLRIFMAGIVMMFGYNGTAAILRGLGDSKTPLVFLILSSIINVILVLLFIVVFKWGIAGTALATVLAQGFSFIAAVIYLNRHHPIISFSLRNIEFNRVILKQIFRIGLPSGLQQTFVALGMMALVRIVNNFGTDVIAAYSVAGRIDSFVSLPAMNFSMALSAFVGQNIGANKIDRVRKGYYSTLLMMLVLTVILTAGILIFTHFLMSVFTHDQKVIELGVQYLYVVSIFYILFNFMFITNGVMRGAGATFIPMLNTLLALWVIRIPVSWYLSKHIGVVGIWWGIPVAWFVGTVTSYSYYLSGKWKNKGVVKYS